MTKRTAALKDVTSIGYRAERLIIACPKLPNAISVNPSILFAELKLWSIYRVAIGYTIGARLLHRGTKVDLRVRLLCPALQRSNCDLRFFHARLNMKRRQERFL
jgi:hypothetical protein